MHVSAASPGVRPPEQPPGTVGRLLRLSGTFVPGGGVDGLAFDHLWIYPRADPRICLVSG